MAGNRKERIQEIIQELTEQGMTTMDAVVIAIKRVGKSKKERKK